ncbi:MAG TPA: DNA translocase FtsK 4TM domain-containing protein, partial [Methylomirabilota bacterium]|nr:DNA translocase FtsK 4TM domain-containing protein [Methylomirabilota bacterium]
MRGRSVARARAKAAPKPTLRWVREAQAVVALGVAAFLLLALVSYDPALHWLDQEAQVGVVGLWIGWALFAAVGYAGYLLPLALAGWAVAAVVRPVAAAGGLSTLVGVALGLLGLTGLLARASGVSRGVYLHRGGYLGRAVNLALRHTLGDLGGLLVLLTVLAVAGLCLTQLSYAGLGQRVAGGLGRLVRRRARPAPASSPKIAESAP